LLDALEMQTTLREGPAAGCAELPHRPPVGAVTMAVLVMETDGSGGTALRVTGSVAHDVSRRVCSVLKSRSVHEHGTASTP
jgi:hypothetical protein